MLIGLAAPDDAGVYRIAPDLALVQTVDFFTPVVDDPYTFGRIAAVNALSDVYAMGARPVTALNVAAFPSGDDPGPAVFARILQGGLDVLSEAGVALLGGHTVDDPEPKYGLAVTGLVHPAQLRTKGGARAGDRLLLTKPIGIGALTTAMKRDLLAPSEADAVIACMLRLNSQTAALADPAVHAVTDVTGFGLLGHLLEVTQASGLGAQIHLAGVPVLDGAHGLVVQGIVPAGSRKNLAYVRPHIVADPAVGESDLQLLADAVTSGGLLVAVASDGAERVAAALRAEGAMVAQDIGRIEEAAAGQLRIQA